MKRIVIMLLVLITSGANLFAMDNQKTIKEQVKNKVQEQECAYLF